MTEFAPRGTTTVAGTVADAVLLLDSVIVRCAAVPTAAAFSTMVAVEFPAPPTTLVGFKVRVVIKDGLTVSAAVVVPFNVAVIAGLATVATTRDVTVKAAVVAPAATVTLAGTVATAVTLLDSVTVLCAAVPTAGAFSVTVAVEFADPPTTLVGFSVIARTPGGGATVRTALCVPPFNVAKIFAVAGPATR